MMGHHEMNGSLTSPGAYASLHNIPPQMSAAAAAAAAYGRSPMVSFGAVRRTFGSFQWGWGVIGLTLIEVEHYSALGYSQVLMVFGLRIVLSMSIWRTSETVDR